MGRVVSATARASDAAPAPGLRAHEKRLRATLRQLLLLSLGAPAAVQASCGSDTGSGSSTRDGGAPDATVLVDGPIVEASDAEAGAPADSEPTDAALDGAATPSDAMGCYDGGATDGPSPFATCTEAGLTSDPYFRCGRPLQCYYYVDLSCPTYPLQSGCYLSASDCLKVCSLDSGFFDCSYTASSCGLAQQLDGSYAFALAEAGPYTIGCGICPNVGRRPAGLTRPRGKPATGALGEYFAGVSHLEAASVLAFRRLRRELRAYGAPRELVRAAHRAARDERRHARVTARLAKRHGATPPPVRLRKQGSRSLAEFALENAVEGCVRETFGAAVAMWQAQHASDPQVRASMNRIAGDETRHAALAWAVAQWAEPRLGSEARDRIARGKQAAIARLARESAASSWPELTQHAGVPDPGAARTLLECMAEAVWV